VYAGPNAVNFYNKIAKFLQWTSFETWVNKIMLKGIGEKLVAGLPNLIIEKLHFKLSADVEAIGCTEAEQGPFLIATMQEFQKNKKAVISSKDISDANSSNNEN
jgi:hypothetical protein